jgi:hypothetical protein
VIAVPFGPHASFVQGPSCLVSVIFATEIAGQFPGYVLLTMTTESEI